MRPEPLRSAARAAGWPASARVGAWMFAALLLAVVAIPILSSSSAWDGDYQHGQMPDGRPIGPGAAHFLGTDRLLRDVLVRLALASAHSIELTVLACTLTASIALVLGCTAGYFEGRWLDRLMQVAIEIALGFPAILLLMTVGSVVRRVDLAGMAALMAAVSWPWMTVTVRARAAEVSRRDFIVGARALGARDVHILWRHLLPNVMPLALRLVALTVAPMILLETALAYVGVGCPPPVPTLGRMLYEGQDAILGAPWLVLAPALVLTWIGVSATLLSNALVVERRS